MKDIKTMSGEEFRELGYLQEANRRFFHPLGLAIAIVLDEQTKEVKAFEIQDHRDDPEGMYFGINDTEYTTFDRLERFNKNKNFIDAEAEKRKEQRIKIIGSQIEEIPDLDSFKDDYSETK